MYANRNSPKRVADSRNAVKWDALTEGRGAEGREGGGRGAASGRPGKRAGSCRFESSYYGRANGKIFRFVPSAQWPWRL